MISTDNIEGISGTSLSKNIYLWPLIILGFSISLWLALTSDDITVFPQAITDPFSFSVWINEGEDWMKKNYRWITRLIAGVIQDWYWTLEDFLIESPWLLIVAFMVLPVLGVAGLRLSIFTLCAVLFWGLVGQWEPAMQTLALMGLSVFMSIIFGVIVGILCSQSDRTEAFVKPILDTMQVMPAFVYLIPAMFFFGIGGPPAIMATMIYALPPVIRLTNLGIRQVPHETIETARSFGSSNFQMLYKIRFPLALPSIMMGINQTIMMALGMVVLATFIGAEGLGGQVWVAIRKLDVGWALEGGICILLMAIMFDRFSGAMSRTEQRLLGSEKVKFYLLPQNLDRYNLAVLIEKPIGLIWTVVKWFFQNVVNLLALILGSTLKIINLNLSESVQNFIKNNSFLVSSLIIFYLIYLFDIYVLEIGEFPDNWTISIREPISNTVAWLTVNESFIAFTKGLRAFVYLYLLSPFDFYLTHIPWAFTMAVFILISFVTVGLRFAIITGLLLLFIGACDIWYESMITLSSVLLSVLISFGIGIPLGIIASYNKTYEKIQEPILDAMQTLPAFCYLVPVLMFFGGNVVSAVIATVIYSLPPIIRLTVLGLSQISESYSEVSKSFGGNTLQTLFKVKFPMAVPSLVMGFNQTVMMAFAMQVVTPLIGGKGLGREVYQALAKSDTGRGLAAGIAIVLLAIILDRISLAWTKKQREALGL